MILRLAVQNATRAVLARPLEPQVVLERVRVRKLLLLLLMLIHVLVVLVHVVSHAVVRIGGCGPRCSVTTGAAFRTLGRTGLNYHAIHRIDQVTVETSRILHSLGINTAISLG